MICLASAFLVIVTTATLLGSRGFQDGMEDGIHVVGACVGVCVYSLRTGRRAKVTICENVHKIINNGLPAIHLDVP